MSAASPFDLAVVGAGASGLAASIEAAALGLRTALVTRSQPGGAARRLSRIESVPGYPVALTGEEFTARAVEKADRSGVVIDCEDEVTNILSFGSRHILTRASGEVVAARAVIITTGAEWSPPPIDGIAALLGSGVYCAPPPDQSSLRGRRIAVFGGLREAAESALAMPDEAQSVCMIVRESLSCLPAKTRARLQRRANVTLLAKTEIVCAAGIDRLESLLLRDVDSGRISAIGADALFITVAASPRTRWLPAELERDCEGFVRTCGGSLETTVAGVFAAGTVRLGVTFGAEPVEDALRAAREAHGVLRGLPIPI